MSIEDGKLLYHLTDIKNIENIVEHGLLSRSSLISNGMRFTDVADQEILEFRKTHNLDSFVPFHFFSKNPFDGRVQKDNPNIEFAYLCILRSHARTMGFQIIPRHPLNMDPFEIYDYDEGINIIDWKTMELRDYLDTNCKEICMAEGIFQGDLPIDTFISINVVNQASKGYVVDMLRKMGIRNVHVNISPNYFVL